MLIISLCYIIILTQISGFVVQGALKKLSCDVCRASLGTDAASAIEDQSYHLLFLKTNGGLVIPSEGTVRVVRAAEWVIRQASSSFIRSQPIKLLEVMYIVRMRIMFRGRSEERRVGKECRARWSPDH